mmetsp:Transcript_17293/g.25823  ORF Transcript_17293/g.25823 Transcript_17293/m.25823 type:complete len:132 (+) Transcript_17293:503-898(+)
MFCNLQRLWEQQFIKRRKSLLRPVYASADEVNEWLVFESLAWKSQTIDGLVLNGGIVLRDLVLNEEKNFCLCQDAYDNLVLTDLIGSARHAFYKEFPDECGLNIMFCCGHKLKCRLKKRSAAQQLRNGLGK